MPLNPRSAYDEVNGYKAKSDADKARTYPQFFSKIRFNTFRHLKGLTFEFKHPITTHNANIVLFCNNSESRSWIRLDRLFTE